jgi:hypothetical protein
VAGLALAGLAAFGCGEEKKMTREEAKETYFKGTDVKSLPPEVQKMLPNPGDGSSSGSGPAPAASKSPN